MRKAKNSNNMEKVGFIKGLKYLRANGMTVDQITRQTFNQRDFSYFVYKWISKNQRFSHLGMVTRSQLAIMDFNSGSDLPQVRNKGWSRKNTILVTR